MKTPSGKSNQRQPTNEEIAAAVAAKSDEETIALVERQKELIAHLFEAGSTYTTVVIVAGYAGLFTIWGTLNPELSRPWNIAVGISLGLSLAAFVYYEVWKMYFYTMRNFRMGAVLGLPPKEALAEIIKIDIAERKKMPLLYTTWLVIFIFTIATSAVGAVILIFNLFARLMGF